MALPSESPASPPPKLGDFLRTVMSEIERRDAALEALSKRVDELEKFPFTYEGGYQAGKAYNKNQLVSHGGSMWVAKVDTAQRPADGNDWTLCVKAGRDAQR